MSEQVMIDIAKGLALAFLVCTTFLVVALIWIKLQLKRIKKETMREFNLTEEQFDAEVALLKWKQ